MVVVVFVSFKNDFPPPPFHSLWELHPVLITAPLSQFGYSLLFPLERNCYRNEGFVCLVKLGEPGCDAHAARSPHEK